MIDQLVIIDRQKGEYHLELRPEMTVLNLKRRIAECGYEPSERTFLHADEKNWPHYVALMQEIWPSVSVEERCSLDRGVHRVAGRISFVFHVDYYRAVAKIAFHYYLLHTKRGVQGTEPEFGAVRNFIRTGGDHKPLYDARGARFALPFGQMRDGQTALPGIWTHVVAADESAGTAVAMVTLFMGPTRMAPIYHIRLATLASRILVPNAQFAHSYLYDACDSCGTHAGRVVPVATCRLR
ncbi:MAG: hypothetical protein ACKVS9_15345 [Phycisphaerae bacterium]